jgi:hypothetical protein
MPIFGSYRGTTMREIKISNLEMSKARTYHTSGTKKIGYRLIVPQKALRTEQVSGIYRCVVKRNGTLIYIPVVQP